MTRRRRGALGPLAAAIGWALVALSGCQRPVPVRPQALEPRGAPYKTGIVLAGPDSVFIYGVRKFRVVRPVTLRSFAPAVVPDGVTVLAARASFLRSAKPRLTPGGWPGAFCTDTWPMAGFGPTYEIDGLEVAAGDFVAFTVYVRAARPGRYVLDGYDLTYEDHGEGTIGEQSGQRADMRVLAPGERTTLGPCNGRVRDIWMVPPPSPRHAASPP
ncbi:MAG: hypothetical protein QOE45_97 [Frankiaceae bacterium]|jgi:hypothetical protein|nr:hypothetical protein [Frankiaceae bacterium]